MKRTRSLPGRTAVARSRSPATDVQHLARVPCLRSLPVAELRRLASRCRLRALRQGQRLFEEGEPCRGFFIVVDGAIEISQTSLRGREQVFHSEGPGATLGEAPLFDRGGYIASAVAVAATRVLFVPRADVLDSVADGRPSPWPSSWPWRDACAASPAW